MQSVVLPNDGEYLSSINSKSSNLDYYFQKKSRLLNEHKFTKNRLWKKYQIKEDNAWMLYSFKRDSVLNTIRILYPQKYKEWYDFDRKGDYENKTFIETIAPEFQTLRDIEKWYSLYENEYSNGYIDYLEEEKRLDNELSKKQKILDSLYLKK